MVTSNNDFKNCAVAIVGMCGSGKSVLAEYFRSKGWFYIHFGQVTIDELNARNLRINEKNERRVREELRTERGMGVYAELLWPEIERAIFRSERVVIDGLYSWSEYRVLRDQLGARLFVIAVVADRQIRYARVATRAVRPLTREEAEQRDIAEIENLEKGGPIAIADFTLVNDGSIDQLYRAANSLVQRLRVC